MKKIFSASVLMILVWGCAKKITPSNSGTSPSNSQSTPAETNTGKGTEPVAILIPTTNTGAAETKVAPKEATAEDAAIIAGQSLYTAKCGRCHNLKVTTDYTAERWTDILAVMAPRGPTAPWSGRWDTACGAWRPRVRSGVRVLIACRT